MTDTTTRRPGRRGVVATHPKRSLIEHATLYLGPAVTAKAFDLSMDAVWRHRQRCERSNPFYFLNLSPQTSVEDNERLHTLILEQLSLRGNL
jgi:hypothetical protein